MPKLKTLALLASAPLAIGAAALAFSHPVQASTGGSAARHNLALSLRLLGQGNATAARSWALKATHADPDWGLAQAVLARTYLALGEGVAAEAALGRARAAGFDAARLHQLSAEALLLQGKPDHALAEARRAGTPYRRYAARVAALALAAKGDLPAAQRLLGTELAAVDGRDAADWAALGRVRQLTGDVGGAIDAARRAIALDPRQVDALTLQAELVRGQYGLVASLPWFEAALKVDPWRHDTLIGYAATLGDAGRNRAMLAAARRALAARPGSPQALYLQAVLAARAGNAELARSMLAKTGGALDGQPGPLLLAGLLDFSDGAYQQAIMRWRAVVAQAPMNLVARR